MGVAVITGAASGIGCALAEAMANRGDTVVMADIAEDIAVVAERAGQSGPGRASGAVVDVRDARAVSGLIDETVATHGRLDILVNNAGVGVGGYTEEVTLSHWDRAVDVNIRGVVHGVNAAYPHMVAQGSGQILNVASLAGLTPTPLFVPYAMSKHAVVGLSLSLRGEAAEHGVRVNTLCPGLIDTPIVDKGNPADLPELPTVLPVRELLERVNRPMPVDRLARETMRAMDNDVAIIVLPKKVRPLWWAFRLAPAAVAKVAARDQLAWARSHATRVVSGQPVRSADAGSLAGP